MNESNNVNVNFFSFISFCRFDLMVVGGGAISISFARHPFITARVQTYVPYNDLVLLDDLWMSLLPGRRGMTYSVPETTPCSGDAYLKPEFSILPQMPMDSCGAQGVRGSVIDQQVSFVKTSFRTIPHRIKKNPNTLPIRTSIPRTTPHQDFNKPVNPLIRTNTCAVGNWWGLSRYEALLSLFFF